MGFLRVGRRIGGLSLLAMALAACMNAPTRSAAPTTAPARAPDCPASGARVEVGPVDAALGQRAVTVSLVNCGSERYAVEGYPAVELLDEEQQPIDVALERDPDPVGNGTTDGPAPIGLAPGERARAVLTWRNTVELGSDPTPGSFVAVTPVAGEAGQVVALAVDLGTTGRLTVGPWEASA